MNPNIITTVHPQVRDWYFDEASLSFSIRANDNRLAIMEWLQESTRGQILILIETFIHSRIYFKDPAEATLFKLTWGG